MSASMVPCLVVTYNTRRCLGSDGLVSPERIALALAALEPDVVALQELDRRVARTGGVDQVGRIAEILGMASHFHPSFHIESGQYGNAILSPHPLQLVRADHLPRPAGRRRREPRGALWAEARVRGARLQVITTHLGLTARERAPQAACLLGPGWAGAASGRGPTVVLGDLNDWARSRVVRAFRPAYRDAWRAAVQRSGRATFPSRWPLLRLDYVFTSPGLVVRTCGSIRTAVTAVASDHLPVAASLEIPRGTAS